MMINLGYINLSPIKPVINGVKIKALIHPTKPSKVTTNGEHKREQNNTGYDRKGRIGIIHDQYYGNIVDSMA